MRFKVEIDRIGGRGLIVRLPWETGFDVMLNWHSLLFGIAVDWRCSWLYLYVGPVEIEFWWTE